MSLTDKFLEGRFVRSRIVDTRGPLAAASVAAYAAMISIIDDPIMSIWATLILVCWLFLAGAAKASEECPEPARRVSLRHVTADYPPAVPDDEAFRRETPTRPAKTGVRIRSA
ncbi:hypothetical protein [Methylocapsa aurea]|uniref:hypothetical protein n=1 Tax=Methylocapsa aurea TaxID=663610 RepID=UPI003D189C01